MKLSSYATTIMATNGRLTVTYQETPIVQTTPEQIILDTGGWWTASTKKKMNEASVQFGLGYRVFQSKHRWYVEYEGQKLEYTQPTFILTRRI